MTYEERIVEALRATLLAAQINADHLKLLATTDEQHASVRDLRGFLKSVQTTMEEIEAVFVPKMNSYAIVINGQTHAVKQSTVGMEDVLMLSGFKPGASVTYHRAAGPKTEGILIQGKTVNVKTGTVFNVAYTNYA